MTLYYDPTVLGAVGAPRQNKQTASLLSSLSPLLLQHRPQHLLSLLFLAAVHMTHSCVKVFFHKLTLTQPGEKADSHVRALTHANSREHARYLLPPDKNNSWHFPTDESVALKSEPRSAMLTCDGKHPGLQWHSCRQVWVRVATDQPEVSGKGPQGNDAEKGH